MKQIYHKFITIQNNHLWFSHARRILLSNTSCLPSIIITVYSLVLINISRVRNYIPFKFWPTSGSAHTEWFELAWSWCFSLKWDFWSYGIFICWMTEFLIVERSVWVQLFHIIRAINAIRRLSMEFHSIIYGFWIDRF